MKKLAMFRASVILIFMGLSLSVFAQYPTLDSLQLEKLPVGISKYWLRMIDDGLGRPITIPVLVAKGAIDGPVLGLAAAIHGNELNGIPVIQQVFERLNVDSLQGTLVAIPGLNGISIPNHQRRYIDEEDLNRNFPGKANGNRSQQYVWQINQKVLPLFDFLIDMHTASFGRVNSLYVRADLRDTAIKQMALLQDADIVLNNKGIPSAGNKSSGPRTMRAEAMLQGIPCITVEYGNPQVYQPEMAHRGVTGVENVMKWLKMMPGNIVTVKPATLCKKSYWVFVDRGGLLDVPVGLTQHVEKGDVIGVLKNPFGDILKTYTAPEKGVIIGKSSNPVNMDGGRIIHLGILED